MGRFWRGSGEVPERFWGGSGQVLRGSGEVLERVWRGSGEVLERVWRGSGEVLGGFGEVLEKFSKRSKLCKGSGRSGDFSRGVGNVRAASLLNSKILLRSYNQLVGAPQRAGIQALHKGLGLGSVQ